MIRRLWIITIVPAVAVTAITICLSPDNQSFEEFDDVQQICCNGAHAKFLKNGDERKCCRVISHDSGTIKEQVYNSRTSFCCGGVLYDLLPEQILVKPKCCGDQVLLNQTTEFCCGNKTYKRSKQYHYCFEMGKKSFPVRSDEKVCSKYTDNGTVDIRVYTKAQVAKNGSTCCGLRLYNDYKSVCFNNELWPVGTIPALCGPAAISHDTLKTVCCQDSGKLIPIPNKERYHNIDPNYSCFKGQLVDLDINNIVPYGEGYVIPKHFVLCGTNFYDRNFSRGIVACCNGTVNYAKSGMDVKCCGNELIDNTEHTCCNNIKYAKSQGCCGNSIYNKYSGDVECCAGQLLNNSYLCCRPQSSLEIPTLKRKRNDNTCCGKTTFHSLAGECCGGKVYDNFGPNQKCNGFGQVVNVSMETSLSDILDQINNSINTGGNEKPKRIRNLDCPACLPYEQPFQECTKKFRYQIYVREIEAKRRITKVHVLLLEPNFMRKTKMVLKTRGKCMCFKQDTVYNLYTNRNLQEKIKGSELFQSKFTERDMLFEVKGNFGNFHRSHTCKIEKYFRPIVS